MNLKGNMLHTNIQSMEFSRPGYWNGQPFPSPGDLCNPGIKPRTPALKEDSLPAEPQREAQEYWSGQPIPSPADLPDPGIELESPSLQADSLPDEVPEKSPGSIPWLRRSPREGNSNPLQYSCLENPMDKEAQQAIVHGAAKLETTDQLIHFHNQ